MQTAYGVTGVLFEESSVSVSTLMRQPGGACPAPAGDGTLSVTSAWRFPLAYVYPPPVATSPAWHDTVSEDEPPAPPPQLTSVLPASRKPLLPPGTPSTHPG